MKYDIIQANSPGGLSELVNEKLEEGWELQGPLKVVTTDHYYLYMHVMTKGTVPSAFVEDRS